MAAPSPRLLIEDFSLANPFYSGATLAVFTVDPVTLQASATLAPLYADLVTATQLANPQVLDGEGKWLQPAYVSGPCIMIVSGTVQNVQSGILGTAPSFQGDWATGIPYFTGNLIRDGAAANNTSGVYYCSSPHTSGTFSVDLGNGLWIKYVDATAISAGVVANALASASASAASAAASASTAGTDATSATASAASASTSAASAASSVALVSAKNWLHNPAFNFFARGVGPFTTNFAYTADRWAASFINDAISVTVQALSDANRSAIGDESALHGLLNVFTGNAAAGAFSVVYQPIEFVRELGNKTVTVSFWAWAAAGTPKLGISIDQHMGTGGSPSAEVNGTGQSITLSTTPTRYTKTFSIPSLSGKTPGTNGDDSTVLLIWYSSGATNSARAGGIGVQSSTGIALWGMKLEVGSVATPFVDDDIESGYAKCQRFYQVGFLQHFGYNLGGDTLAMSNLLPVVMRAQPTITPTITTSVNVTGASIVPVGNFGVQIAGSVTGTGAFGVAGSFTASADL